MKARCLLLVVSYAVYFIQHTEGARILGIFPLHGKSHSIMFEEVMKGLADAGHQVDVVSHFPQKKPYANYTDLISLAGTLPDISDEMSHIFTQFSYFALAKRIFNMIGNDICNLLELPELQELIKNPPSDPPYHLVVTEFFFASCYFAFGRHLNVPVVAVSSGAAIAHADAAVGNPENTAIVSQIGSRPATYMNFWQRLKNTVGVFFGSIITRYGVNMQNDIVRKHFGPDMPDVEQLEHELSLYLVNSHPIIHGARPLTPGIVEVAGLHARDDGTPLSTELQKWLDDSRNGFIYFTLGSMMQIEAFPKATLDEIYVAFAKVAPIRIVMRVKRPEELPPGLPDNVLTLPWAPQIQILKHKNIRGFMTHGGLMGLQEALTFAVPLIGIPLFGDQPGNIEICVERGIAVSLDHTNLKTDEIVAGINAVAHDPKYKNNMKTISKQFLNRPLNARDTAVFWIEYILRHGGDGLRSPAVYLTWWQLSLLDVYGSIIAAILIVLYLLKIIISAIIGRIYVYRLHKQSIISIQKGKLKSKKN